MTLPPLDAHGSGGSADTFAAANALLDRRLPSPPAPSLGPLSSTQPNSRARRPTNQDPSRSRRGQGRPSEPGEGVEWWRGGQRNWNNDGNDRSHSSEELLLRWLERTDNWRRFYGGLEGYSQTSAAEECSKWLWEHRAPTNRTGKACRQQVQRQVDLADVWQINIIHKRFTTAFQWFTATGRGQGGREIANAAPEDRESVIQSCLGEYFSSGSDS